MPTVLGMMVWIGILVMVIRVLKVGTRADWGKVGFGVLALVGVVLGLMVGGRRGQSGYRRHNE